MAELKGVLSKQNAYKMKFRKIYNDQDFISTNLKYPGYPLYVKFIELRMARLIKLAKLNTSLTPHSLRHTHASLLAEAGATLESIMERLGQVDDETTRKVYLHITKGSF